MEAARVPHLHIVDTETGERYDLDQCPQCQVMQDKLDGAEKDINAWRTRYANLKRDKEAEARKSPVWTDAVRLFRLWKVIDHHPNSEFTHERFAMVEPILKLKPPKGGVELCVRAIVGKHFDPFTTRRKNGTTQRHTGWHLIFGERTKFEEACCKAPDDWRERAADAGWEWPEA